MKVMPGELCVYQAVHHNSNDDITIYVVDRRIDARRECGGLATLSEGDADLAVILAKEES